MGGLLDSVFSGLAKSLIGTFGTQGVLTEPGTGTYDPIADVSVTGVDIETTVNCSPPEAYSQRDIDGTRILTGDMSVMIATADYPSIPKTTMTFTIRGQIFKIVDVTPMSSGNSEAAWKLQLRR